MKYKQDFVSTLVCSKVNKQVESLAFQCRLDTDPVDCNNCEACQDETPILAKKLTPLVNY